MFLTKAHTLKLDEDGQFQDYINAAILKGVDEKQIYKLKRLQTVLKVCLMSKSNKEILNSLMELEIIRDLVYWTKDKLEDWRKKNFA